MEFEISQDESVFAGLQGEWNGITAVPFASWEWNHTWWQNFGKPGKLRLITARDAGRLLGVAPMFLDFRHGGSRLRLIGSGKTCTDYVGFIGSADAQQQLCDYVAQTITRMQRPPSLVEFEGITSTSACYQLAADVKSKYWNYMYELESSWVVDLPASQEELVARYQGNVRRKFKAAMKRLSDGSITLSSTSDNLSIRDGYEILVALHQSRQAGKGEAGVFADPRFAAFVHDVGKQLICRKLAQYTVVWAEEKPIAAAFVLSSPNGPQLYLQGICRDSLKYEPGFLLNIALMFKAIEEGLPTMDFLRGNEPYKQAFGARPVPMYKLRYVSKNWRSTLTQQAFLRIRKAQWCLRRMRNRKSNPTHMPAMNNIAPVRLPGDHLEPLPSIASLPATLPSAPHTP